MTSDHLEIAAGIGFVVTWLGLALLILPTVLRMVLDRSWWRSLSRPFSERAAVQLSLLNQALAGAGKTRVGRVGQALIAAGSSILILAGIAWLAVRILQ